MLGRVEPENEIDGYSHSETDDLACCSILGPILTKYSPLSHYVCVCGVTAGGVEPGNETNGYSHS